MRLDQRVEQVEELFLCPTLAAEELDVIDEQQVERSVIALEVVEGLVLISADDVGYIGLGVDVANLRIRVGVENVIADRLDQVRLAQPNAAINEQRVVRRRMFGDLQARRASELIGLAGDESGKGKSGIEARLRAASAALSWRWRGCRRRRERPDQLFGDDERHPRSLAQRCGGELFDPRDKPLLDPLQDKPVRRNQH